MRQTRSFIVAMVVIPTGALVAAVTGCGLGIIEPASGEQDILPGQGAGPYGKLPASFETPADEPYVVSMPGVHLRDPAALRLPDGRFRLWFGHQAVGADTGEIWSAELGSLTELPEVGPVPALAADQAWEAGWVGAPSVVALADGTLVMFYQGSLESPAIGRAESRDGGVTWEKYGGNPVLTGAAEPAAARLPAGESADAGAPWVMYVTRQDRDGIFLAQSADGMVWTPEDDEPVLAPRKHLAMAYDRDAVTDPHVVIQRTGTGDLHYGMFFNGTRQNGEVTEISVGWAGSFDGLDWHRWSSPDEPVLAPEGASEHAPAVVLAPEGSVMFFHEGRQGAQRIGVAVHP